MKYSSVALSFNFSFSFLLKSLSFSLFSTNSRKAVVMASEYSITLPSLGGGPQVGDDGDGLLYVGSKRCRGDLRYDMFWTEVAARRTDGADVKVLV